MPPRGVVLLREGVVGVFALVCASEREGEAMIRTACVNDTRHGFPIPQMLWLNGANKP